MIGLTKAGVEAWNEKVDEIIGGGEIFVDEEYNKEHPIPDDEELEELFRRYGE